MDNSILDDVKIFCGITPEYTHFDIVIINKINSALSFLRQLGVGPVTGFIITGNTEKWSDLIGEDLRLICVKDYVESKVKLEFDPPSSSVLLEALKETVRECEFRINTVTDYEIEEVE